MRKTTEEIIERYERLETLHHAIRLVGKRGTRCVSVVDGRWHLTRSERRSLVRISAQKSSETVLVAERHRDARSWAFRCYEGSVCEEELLPLLRRLMVLEDLSRL